MQQHIPVLRDEVVEYFEKFSGGLFIDATLGYGGHTFSILDTIPKSRVIGIDADESALAAVRNDAAERGFGTDRLTLVHGNFRTLRAIAAEQKIDRVDGILVDFGFSSGAMDDPLRGLSFQREGPLDMRFDVHGQTLTAAEIVNTWSEKDIADTIYQYGEDRMSRQIAGAIVQARGIKPFTTTTELVKCIETVVKRRGRLHPATRTFQALRIAVNDELNAIHEMLPQARDLLRPGGRLLTISFHSLEDRIVKEFMKVEEKEGALKRLTKHVVKPTRKESEENRRSRSAKMRILEKT
jgi:16S rRNA (cytosine1402-N4)-methyltransferase